MICPKCNKVTSRLVYSPLPKDTKYTSLCPDCINSLIPNKSPVIHNCDSFNPHYDAQLGEYFQSKEQKQHFLKITNQQQASGTLSPRISEGIARLKMTKDQYTKLVKDSKL